MSVFLSLLCIVLFLSLLSLIFKYRKLKQTFRNHKKSLRSILKTINSVRYGNLYERVNPANFVLLPNFSESINRMIESIVDRENMINEYQADLNKKIEALKEIEQLKEDFVATLTHDLKVPIIAEKNMLHFLEENRFGDLTEKQREAVIHLQNSNKELIELVEIILETYKLNETNIILNKERVDIGDLINTAIEEMQPIADANSQKINFDSHHDGFVNADKFYLKRVLKNIILNGLSYTDSRGCLDICITDSQNSVDINITNYGKYISEEEIEHIFDKYYSSAKKFRKIGTGLGLYLSNKIIDAHEGKIKVESQKDSKTTFVISLKK